MLKVYKLVNLDCPVCASKMEKAIKKIKGIKAASVSYMNQKMIVEADNVEILYDDIVNACRKIEPELEIM